MQGFCCSFARSLLEGLGDGTFDYLSAVVMPHTCDTIRNLSDLAGLANPGIRVITLMVPTDVCTPEAREFFAEELIELKSALEELSSRKITDSDIVESIGLLNRCRASLHGMRGLNLSNRELYASYLACQLMDRSEFPALAEEVEAREEKRDWIGVALIGGPMPGLEVFSVLDNLNLSVVWDDICTASRYASEPVSTGGDPLRALAERYLGRVPCPTKTDPEDRRAQALIEGVRSSGAAGVIFLQEEFCEFHAFDYPWLKDRLDVEGIPSMKLALGYPYEPAGQEMTRLQAFAEILAERT